MELHTITDVDDSPKSPITRRFMNMIETESLPNTTPIHIKKCKSQTPERIREDAKNANYKNFDIKKQSQSKKKIPMSAIQSILSL